MKTEDQIKALAELDGWNHGEWYNDKSAKVVCWRKPDGDLVWDCLPYLTSYDAIIPLIQKQDRPTQIRMMKLVAKLFGQEVGWDATPTQLSEALLRATGHFSGVSKVVRIEYASSMATLSDSWRISFIFPTLSFFP